MAGFENKILFVNGKIGFGSPPSGRKFWKKNFIKGAIDFFPDRNACFFADTDYNYTDDVKSRFLEGSDFAATYYDEITEGMQKPVSSFRLVTHSMGAAFGEGIKKVLIDEGWCVDYCVHINAWQAGSVRIIPCDTCFLIDYQNIDDPLRFMITNHTGAIKGADLAIHEPTGYPWYHIFYKHRSPIHKGRSFWKRLESSLPVNHRLSGS